MCEGGHQRPDVVEQMQRMHWALGAEGRGKTARQPRTLTGQGRRTVPGEEMGVKTFIMTLKKKSASISEHAATAGQGWRTSGPLRGQSWRREEEEHTLPTSGSWVLSSVVGLFFFKEDKTSP